MDRLEVYKRIDGERNYQELRKQALGWSEKHSVGDWVVFMEQYMRQAIERGSKESGWNGALEELRKVAALAIACFEEHGVPERQVKNP
jgi:hypothetical protein